MQLHIKYSKNFWDASQANEVYKLLIYFEVMSTLCEISGPHGGEYDVQSLLGYTAM
jgi:hypothetical protein